MTVHIIRRIQGSRVRGFAATGAVAGAVALLLLVAFESGSAGAVSPLPIDLGTAASYAVLAGTTVTNTGPSTVQGSVGGAALSGVAFARRRRLSR